MFVSQEVVLDVGFPAAEAGLGRLTVGTWLREASGQAYDEGLVGLVRVGPFGDAFGAAKLVRVSLLEPVPRDELVALALRWEATGVMGRLFPVLDANLELAPAGECHSTLVMTGAYRPPLAAMGQELDRVVLHQAAAATVRSFLKQMGEAIVAAPLVGGQAAVTVTPVERDPAGQG